MQNNGPVTRAEYVLPDDEVIITHTDLTSRITYANPAFFASSQFSLEECMGQPQNIVRHPDMPKEAFADLWATIGAGQSWSGIVKNRRKDGGFYWVRANVTPMVEERGRIVGYMSVRTKPTRAEIAQAERVYADIRNGRAHNIQIVRGRIRDMSLVSRLGRLVTHLSLERGSWLVLGTLMTLLSAILITSVRSTGMGITAWLSLAAISLVCANLYYVQRYVARPVRQLQTAASKLLSGDTQTRISSDAVQCIDALAEGFEQLRVKLHGVLKDNHQAATEVHGGVSHVVNASSDISNRTQEHAASLEQTAASIEQITATVERNTEGARQAAGLANESFELTARGRRIVGDMHATMGSILDSSRRIGDIVGLIDGIAFQTNLLALNAAVEAARAGEQGRGFAVVAQEVHSLAQRSATAAKEIKNLISTSSEAVTRGSELAGEAESSMGLVVDSVKRVSQMIQDIEGASREQAAGVEQISQAVTQMDTITQRDAHAAQKLLQTATDLQSQSQYMFTAISAFAMRPAEAPAATH
ncbi:methyl-accepting chemotaxis protein [Steroidobacter flavus]|uniref:Methyl-accepting chemotaxis protein n=1 Tax=Steroidobacter flavus TaxID=1842136 RepID=A0ABV8SZ40_9GAMM